MELRANVIVSMLSFLEKLKGFKIFNLKLLSLFLLMWIGTILQLNFFTNCAGIVVVKAS